jgi:hypothetical protein
MYIELERKSVQKRSRLTRGALRSKEVQRVENEERERGKKLSPRRRGRNSGGASEEELV